MSIKKKRSLKILTAFLCMAIVLLSGLAIRSFAALRYGQSKDIDMELSSLDVRLLENGKPSSDKKGVLLSGLDGSTLDPGYMYDETIAARNTVGQSEYVRVIVKKYWLDKNGSKLPDLDPSLIRLSYGGRAYNSDAWLINTGESTAEQSVYYLKKALTGKTDSPALFDRIGADASIAGSYEMKESDDGRTVTAVYDYDGIRIGLDIEVQSIQYNHGDEAVTSAWGVTNVTVSNGSISISQ